MVALVAMMLQRIECVIDAFAATGTSVIGILHLPDIPTEYARMLPLQRDVITGGSATGAEFGLPVGTDYPQMPASVAICLSSVPGHFHMSSRRFWMLEMIYNPSEYLNCDSKVVLRSEPSNHLGFYEPVFDTYFDYYPLNHPIDSTHRLLLHL